MLYNHIKSQVGFCRFYVNLDKNLCASPAKAEQAHSSMPAFSWHNYSLRGFDVFVQRSEDCITINKLFDENGKHMN